MPPPKSHYIPTIYILSLVSLLGGLFSASPPPPPSPPALHRLSLTISPHQFLALILSQPACTRTLSRLQVHLAMPSILFLSTTLLTLLLTTLLPPLCATDLLTGSRRRLFRGGLALAFLFSCPHSCSSPSPSPPTSPSPHLRSSDTSASRSSRRRR